MMATPRWRTLVAVLVLSGLAVPAGGQDSTAPATPSATFVDIGATIEGVVGSIDWGDYDNDGDLDIVLAGVTSSTYATRVYRNDGSGAFTDIAASLLNGNGASVAWGDLDNDGDLDLAVAIEWTTRLFRNDGAGGFSEIPGELPGYALGSVAWGDCDNDGDLDLLISGGSTYSHRGARIYRNDGGAGFNWSGWEVAWPLESRAAWGDYDNDGDLDVVLTGLAGSKRVTYLCRNEGRGLYSAPVSAFVGVWRHTPAWGDFDGDGDLDLLLAGNADSGRIAKVYRNDGGGVFVDLGAALTPVGSSDAAWGDYDNDGDLDLVLSGSSSSGSVTKVYRNDGGSTFVDVGATLAGIYHSKVAWGDYDNDGDLDILLAGYDGSYVTKIYRNDGTSPNGAPGAPADLSAPKSAGRAALGWLAASDPETPSSGLTYNIRVGTTPGGFDVVSPMAVSPDGRRRLAAMGNAQHGLSAFIEPLGPGTYYWSVQAVDTAFAGSPFAAEGTAEVCGAVLDPASLTVPAVGGPAPVSVAAAGDCAWVAASPASWVTVTAGSSGTGSGIVALSVAPNPGPARVAELMIAGQTFTLTQGSGCTFLLSPEGVRAGELGGDATFSVTTEDGCTWGATSDGSWVTVDWFSGLGSGQVYYTVVPNSGPERAATITVGGLATFKVVQDRASFPDVGTGLPSAAWGDLAWGDYDADGDLDLAVTGGTGGSMIGGISRNDGGGVFADIGAPLVPVTGGSLDWGDYDNDGDLDLLETGYTGEPPYFATELYRNDGGAFVRIDSGLAPVADVGSWGDYDNDGDLDILISGSSSVGSAGVEVSRIYRNDGAAGFVDIAAGLTPVWSANAGWVDYDNDGDLDVFLAGSIDNGRISKLYRNDGHGGFEDIGGGFTPVAGGTSSWGDYDNDGDLDLLLTGDTGLGSAQDTAAYRNDGGGSFVKVVDTLADVSYGSAWGDYDNDGDLDVLVAGYEYGDPYTFALLFRNGGGGVFTRVAVNLPAATSGVAWGDFDGDGDLDVAMSGDGQTTAQTRVLRNDIAGPGAPPSAPGGLAAPDSAGQVTLAWLPSLDGQTPSAGLTYNVRVSTTPGGVDIVSPMSAVATGYRRVVDIGNTSHGTTALLRSLEPGTYYWSVQAVDTAFAGSSFAPEQSFTACSASIEPAGQAFGSGGGSGSVAMTTGSACAWVADPEVDWISVTGASSGTGSGTVEFAVAPNPGPARRGRIMIGGQPFTVDQGTGCSFALDPTSAQFLPVGGQGTFTVSVYSTCSWTAVSHDEWITVSSGAGIGDGSVSYSVAANTTAVERTGTITVGGQTFTLVQERSTLVDVAAGLVGVAAGSTAWGDYDNDGDLDIALAGWRSDVAVALVYRNDGGGYFTDLQAGLTGADGGSVCWGDFDNDGDLDLLVTGNNYAYPPQYAVAKLYRNESGGFTEVPAGLTAIPKGTGAWGDFDSDGDLDILLTGSGQRSVVYRNDGGGSFTDIHAQLGADDYILIDRFYAAWGDYDRDGDLDILLSGGMTRVYRNDGGGVFTEFGATLPAYSATAWTDYDGDGDLDIAFLGGGAAAVFRYDGNDQFSDSGASLPTVHWLPGALAWGDYDNDGDPDLVMSGYTDVGSRASVIYRNDGPGSFTDIGSGIAAAVSGSLAWGDYDADGDLDLLLTGQASPVGGEFTSTLYRNDVEIPNSAPTPPTDMVAAGGAGQVALTWSPSSDGQTPVAALTYNLRVATTPGGIDVVSPMASPETGLRRLPQRGNAGHATSAMIRSLAPGTYYWSVQAVDTAFAGSPFSAEGTFQTCALQVDPTTQAFGAQGGSGTVSVSTSPSCSWEATRTVPWITITSGGTGSGNGTLAFTVGVNSGPARTGAILVGDLVVSINQGSGCTFALDPGSVSLGAVGGWGEFSLVAPPTCSWAVTSDSSWLTSQDAGTGSATINFIVAMNNTPASRTGHLLVGEATFTVVQDRSLFLDTGLVLEVPPRAGHAWGDFDRDGDLDFLVGNKVYRNEGGGAFVDAGAGLAALSESAVAWGDFDNDGDLDILLAGEGRIGYFTKIYRNDGVGLFTDIGAPLIGVTEGSVAWGDYDLDGDLDALVVGRASSTGWDPNVSRLYRNDHGAFVAIGANLQGISGGSASWGDYDNDGDPDILLTGHWVAESFEFGAAIIYRNDGAGTFTDIAAPLASWRPGPSAWGDYDNDGDLDILVSHWWEAPRVYRNDGAGVFVDTAASLAWYSGEATAWADIDNDGDLDLLVASPAPNIASRIYRNDGVAGFADIGASLPNGDSLTGGFGDYDNDGDLDLLLGGRLYRNDVSQPNSVPTPPAGLVAAPTGDWAALSWLPAIDAQTPTAGLTYNVRVSTTPGGVDILPPMASVATGWRQVPAMGNGNLGTSALLTSLQPGTYYWSVQAIDTAFAGSPFAPEATFTIAGTAGTDTPGIYRSSDRSWYLKNSNTPGAADLIFPYGDPSDQAVKGDWDGDGDDTVGIYRDGVFFLKNTNGPGNADLVIGFGAPGDIPVAGDWDGDGVDTIGVYRPSEAAWFLRNTNTAGAPDLSFTFGLANETPVVGDWDGDGIDTVGIFRASDRQWYLHNSNAGGNAELVFPYGDPAMDVPVVGDWDGDGDDTVGIYRAALGEWFLKNTNEAGFADLNFVYGLVNEKPLAGDWDGS
jgi:hypothetical protein